ncbi:MAG: 3-hydroxyacyl-CoA dehydrogenase NAD-binding domain-containing protein [Haloarculaceae archaeon]
MTPLNSVSIIGAGDMGHGFAAHFTRTGKDVTLVDHRQSNLDEAAANVLDVVEFLNGEGLADLDPESVVDDIEFTLDRDAGVADADLVLETVTEDLEVKHEVFSGVVGSAPEDAVLASNTSGIPVTDIAEAVPEASDRVAGCHWWFPPYLLPTVEVVRGEGTSDETFERLATFVESVDRDPIRVEKDVPGFVWNRLQLAVFREALHLLEREVASADDINRAIRDGWAIRSAAIGPFETMDIAGLDLVSTVAEELNPHLCDDDEPSPLFEENLSAGRGGIQDGAGFFEYDEAPSETVRRRDETVAAIRRALGE